MSRLPVGVCRTRGSYTNVPTCLGACCYLWTGPTPSPQSEAREAQQSGHGSGPHLLVCILSFPLPLCAPHPNLQGPLAGLAMSGVDGLHTRSQTTGLRVGPPQQECPDVGQC